MAKEKVRAIASRSTRIAEATCLGCDWTAGPGDPLRVVQGARVHVMARAHEVTVEKIEKFAYKRWERDAAN